ncbi:exocyst complex component 1-like [Geothlypis trichas]
MSSGLVDAAVLAPLKPVSMSGEPSEDTPVFEDIKGSSRPLETPPELAQHFFEGVKARLAQGVKEEELSFQLAYSKQELRKVIEKYPGKEVKRALESLYRTIHKHLSPEENLLPVVWQAMEQGFIRQYQEFEELIQRCYAGAGIALEFSMEDLLSYFNSITMANM